jgi:Rrf2 family protein
MIFSKSFGYAVRGLLFIAFVQDEKRYVRVEEIAAGLSVPRHFMGKILKRLVKEDLLYSVKGPSGGFMLREGGLKIPLLQLMEKIDGLDSLQHCVIRVKECNEMSPCPLHFQMEEVKKKMRTILSDTTVGDLLHSDSTDFLRSISIVREAV